MPTHTIVSTAANAVVGTDLLKDSAARQSSLPRRVKFVSMTGSTAIGDTEIQLFGGNELLGNFFNTHAGASTFPLETDRKPMEMFKWLRADETLRAVVVDAADTQNVVLELVIEEIPKKKYGYRR